MRRGPDALAVVLLVSTGLAAPNPPGLDMPLARSTGGLPIVVLHAGEETLRFGLDTGTSRSLVSAGVARQLGLRPHAGVLLADVAGAPRGGLCARAPLLRLGELPIALDCLGWVPEEWTLAGAEDVDGVLGADALAHFDLWIDLRHTPVRARLAPPGSLVAWMDGTRLRLDVIGRRPAIATELDFGHHTPAARLVLDSGSDGLVLFGPLAGRAALARPLQRTTARIQTATSTRGVTMVPLDGLRSGRLLLGPGWAALLPHVLDRTEDGLLPLAALGPVLLDVSNGVVVAGARVRRTPRGL
jgi:hypothetical protein